MGAEEVVDVGQRVADRAHFPVQDADDARFGLVEDEVVDLVVAVDEGALVGGLGGGVAEEGYHVVLVGDLAYGLAGFFVLCRGLCLRDGVEGCDLAVVEAAGLAVGGEVDRGRLHTVELGERGYGRAPPGRSV